MNFEVTNPLTGKSRTLVLQDSVQSALQLRHENLTPFYNKDSKKDTLARRLGLDYTKMELLRRSPEFNEEVSAFISVTPDLEDDAETRQRLGVMPAERRYRSKTGFSNMFLQELGKSVVNLITNEVSEVIDEDSIVTADYVRKIADENLTVSEPLPEPPKKEVKERKLSKTAALEQQVAELRARLEAEGVDMAEYDSESDE